MKFKIPSRLQKGDKVAILSPSAGLASVFNLNFGHTDPQMIIPNGGIALIDGNKKTIRLQEIHEAG